MTRIRLAQAQLQHKIGFATARHEMCGTRRKAYAGLRSISKKDGARPSRSSFLTNATSSLTWLVSEVDAIMRRRESCVSV